MGCDGDQWLPVLLSQVSICCVQAETTAPGQEAPQAHAALSKTFHVRRSWSHAPETTPQVEAPAGVCKGENSASPRNPVLSDLSTPQSLRQERHLPSLHHDPVIRAKRMLTCHTSGKFLSLTVTLLLIPCLTFGFTFSPHGSK